MLAVKMLPKYPCLAPQRLSNQVCVLVKHVPIFLAVSVNM